MSSLLLCQTLLWSLNPWSQKHLDIILAYFYVTDKSRLVQQFFSQWKWCWGGSCLNLLVDSLSCPSVEKVPFASTNVGCCFLRGFNDWDIFVLIMNKIRSGQFCCKLCRHWFKMVESFLGQFIIVEKWFAAVYQNENIHVNPLEKCLLNNSQFLLPELAFCIFPLAIFSKLCVSMFEFL